MAVNSVSIKKFEDKYTHEIIDLWNEICLDEVPYKMLSSNDFNEKFLSNPYFDYNGTFVLIENERVVGFTNAIYKKDFLPGETFENLPGYITMVMVRKDKRGRGYGRLLIESAEKYLKESGKSLVKIDFLNPINLEWIIPGTFNHDHPNAPGVDMDGDGYGFFKKMGYIERNVEVSMYTDLSKFYLSDDINKRYKKLWDEGVAVEIYDKSKHIGLDSFFDNLNNEYWRKCINDNLNQAEPFPFIVAAYRGKVCGFAGPLEIEKSGRGKFCGIGVEPAFEGKGIGTVLFFMLCLNFKEINAGFMSLFTGQNGNARKIYSLAGFKVVRKWALFKKDL